MERGRSSASYVARTAQKEEVMETEIQKRRTFEILAKYIAQKNDVTIVFEPDKVQCDVKARRITLPSNVKTDNIYPAIAWVMHEAAHIAHTTFDAATIVQDETDFMILNSVEDVRIDRRNFSLLPNVKGIYEEMVKFVKKRNEEMMKDAPIESKVLVDAIMMAEEFSAYTSGDRNVREFIEKMGIVYDINNLSYKLDRLEVSTTHPPLIAEVRALIKEIRDKLFLAKKQMQQPPTQALQPGKGPCQPSNAGDKNATKKDPSNSGNGKPEPNGQAKENGNQDSGEAPSGDENGDTEQGVQEQTGDKVDDKGKQGNSGSNQHKDRPDEDKLDLSAAHRATGGGLSGEIFGQLDKNAVNPACLGAASLHERTRSDFKELLNIKERHKVNDGPRLDTDNLTAYFTGDIQELFEDETFERKKKSKILILLDSSGSMEERIIHRHVESGSKCHTLVETIKSIVDIIKEVQMLDGLEVDYDVRAFDNQYNPLTKDDWEKEYMGQLGGGTNLARAFSEAQKELLEDYTIEGRRLILAVTDGEVDMSQLQSIQNDIIRNNADVRALIIGIGAEPNGQFIKKISGHNILDKTYADAVLLEAIQEMMA
jgi:hypothetical protein